MKINIEHIVRSGYVAAFIMILASYLLFFFSLKESLGGRKQILHSNEVINKLDDLISSTKDAETGARGYVIIKDKAFLKPYYDGVKHVGEALHSLDSLIPADNKQQAWRLRRARQIVTEKLQVIEEGLAQFRRDDLQVKDSIKVLMYYGKSLMDSFRSLVSRMQEEESLMLAQQEKGLLAINNSTRAIAIISLLIVALMGAYSMITFNKENKDKKAADSAASTYYRQLENRVEELDKKNIELAHLKSMEKYAATGRMASTMAHEIKNPLNNISLAMEHLKDSASHDPDSIQLLGVISRNADRINDIVTDLLNATRFLVLNFNNISINDLIDQALETAKDRLQLHNVSVVKDYSKDICKVSVDAEKIKIALLNIFVNAVEAMDGRFGIIEIKTEARNNKCMITIRDNGKGIDPDTLSKIFEPFITSKASGTGLGLTNTQNIILNHKGTISVESRESEGTVFIISLPFARE